MQRYNTPCPKLLLLYCATRSQGAVDSYTLCGSGIAQENSAQTTDGQVKPTSRLLRFKLESASLKTRPSTTELTANMTLLLQRAKHELRWSFRARLDRRQLLGRDGRWTNRCRQKVRVNLYRLQLLQLFLHPRKSSCRTPLVALHGSGLSLLMSLATSAVTGARHHSHNNLCT